MASRAQSPVRPPPLLPALFFLAAAGSWPFFEYYAIQTFDGGYLGYNWAVESLSDLGVDYRQVHPLKHYNVHSHRHASQNFNFQQAGVLFGLAQLYLLYASRRRASQDTAMLRTIRLLLTLAYAGGMVLLGRVHGGPREKHWQIIGWHWTGLTMAALAGGLNSILAGAAVTTGAHEKSIIYRFLSLALGGATLYSFYRFQTLGTWNLDTKLGLWQRGMIYPVLIWELATAVAVVISNAAASPSKAKRN